MEAHPSLQGHRSLLTPSRVLAVGFVAVSVVSAAWIVREEPALGRVALLAGTPLPTSELALMEAAFDRAKLTDYSIERGSIHVPKHRQSAYMRALVDAQALPKEFGGSLRRALESNSPWQSRTTQEELLRIATQDELRMVLCSMPGIKRASVLYDEEDRPGAGGGRDKTASVNIETEDDAAASPERMRAIRVLVAASIAGLEPTRVAVTDLRSGRVVAGPLDGAAPGGIDPSLAAQASYEEHLAAKVRQALGFVKGAIVDVSVVFTDAHEQTVDEGDDAESQRQSRIEAVSTGLDAGANAPAEVAVRSPETKPRVAVRPQGAVVGGRLLQTVQASIAVPETYFQSLRDRAAAPLDPREQVAVEDRELGRIRDHVLEVLPPACDPSGRKVRVTTFPVIAATSFRGEPAAMEPPARLPTAMTGRASGRVDSQEQESDEGEIVSLRLPPAIARLVSRKNGGPVAVPRESLLAGTSILFGLLAGLLWLFGGPSARARHLVVLAAVAIGVGSHVVDGAPARADEAASAANAAAAVDSVVPVTPSAAGSSSLATMLERLFAGRSLGVSLSAVLVFGVASLAPAVLLMTTSFVRMSVVLSLVRQGIGTPQLPSNQVVTSLAIFLTALVMWPVWTAVWRQGVEPYTAGRAGLAEAFDAGVEPVRRWMTGQIQAAGNADTLGFFVARAAGQRAAGATPTAADAATPPIEALLPAFLVSELEVAFAIGLRLLVPFLVLDVVVGSVVTAMGLASLSPAAVALPLKLLVFVLADGWTLIVKSLLDGFAAVG